LAIPHFRASLILLVVMKPAKNPEPKASPAPVVSTLSSVEAGA